MYTRKQSIRLVKLLGKIKKLDVGDAKKSRMRTYVQQAVLLDKPVNLKKLSQLSRKAIIHEKYNLNKK